MARPSSRIQAQAGLAGPSRLQTVLDSKDGRCFNCSGKGHSRRDCPAGKRAESRGPQGGSEGPRVAKTTRIRSRSQERKSGPGKEGGAAQERPEPVVKINPMGESTVTITPVPEKTEKVVGEVTNLLKGLNGPVLKSMGHGGDHLEVEFDDGTGLLDGGATHPLRQGSRCRSLWSSRMEILSSIRTL